MAFGARHSRALFLGASAFSFALMSSGAAFTQTLEAEAVTRSALERKESRGAQFRDDYPEKDATFGKVNITLRKQPDGSMEVRRVPIPEMPAELKQIIEEMK